MAQETVRGFVLGEVMSALQKSIRRCDEEGAICWAVEMDQSGHGQMLWNRLLIITSEDIGLAEPDLPAQIRALYDNWKEARARRSPAIPERLFVLHAVMLMARARKSRRVDNAIWASYAIPEPLAAEIPDYAIDGHTARGRREGRSNTAEKNPDSYALVNEADLGHNPYDVRKQAYRQEHGFGASKKQFQVQGKSAGSKAAREYEEEEQAGGQTGLF
jgi:replication-associated recombination protein RarA